MRTIDISGMGGGYENECQKMLKAGVEYLKDYPGPFEVKEFDKVYGLLPNDQEPKMKQIQDHIVAASDDPTGAMVHTVLKHLWFIAKNGQEKWLDEFKDQPERYFVWDGTAATCPKTEISEKMEPSQ